MSVNSIQKGEWDMTNLSRERRFIDKDIILQCPKSCGARAGMSQRGKKCREHNAELVPYSLMSQKFLTEEERKKYGL